MGRKVIVAGHICLDVTPTFPPHDSEGIADAIRPGKLVNVGRVDVSTGGLVANTGLAMKYFGCDVRLLGKVGEDPFGNMVADVLSQHGAADGLIRAKGESTSYSIVLAIPGIDRAFLHNPGANDSYSADDVPKSELEDAVLFHFGYPTLMARMYRENGRELTKVMRRAREMGVATSLDLAAVDPQSEAGGQDWDVILRNTLPYVDFFVPSVEELCFMLDRTRYDRWQADANGHDITEVIDIETDVKPLARRCLSYGAKVVLLKCGVRGMYCCSAPSEAISEISPRAGLDAESWGDLDCFEGSYVPEKVLSGTGAGDTSIAAFLTAMLGGEKPEMCLHLAAATGASCVGAYDALSGLRPLGELRQKILDGWEKYPAR